MRSPARTRTERGRLSLTVFGDLAVWMATFGVLVGVLFPFAIVLLGIPVHLTVRLPFFAATVTAGALVAAANFGLARYVVGRRLRVLSGQMHRVGDVLEEATHTGDWAHCDPGGCSLSVDSHDEIGEASAAFNRLITAVAASHEVEERLATYTRSLAHDLDVTEVSRTALTGLRETAGADAGAVCTIREGGLHAEVTHRLRTDGLCADLAVAAASKGEAPVLLEVPDAVLVDAAVGAFRPRAVIILPLRFHDVPIAVVVLAFREVPRAHVLRLLANLSGPTSVALHNALAHQRFQNLAAIDELTGAYNRRFGRTRLDEEWTRARRGGTALGVLSLDLDRFKTVNDTHGHVTGDRVLRDVIAAARTALRAGDLLVRTGGDEFLVVIPGAGLVEASATGERVRLAIAAAGTELDDGVVWITASIGGAALPDTGAVSPGQLVEQSDLALYRAKAHGRDQVVLAPRADALATATG